MYPCCSVLPRALCILQVDSRRTEWTPSLYITRELHACMHASYVVLMHLCWFLALSPFQRLHTPTLTHATTSLIQHVAKTCHARRSSSVRTLLGDSRSDSSSFHCLPCRPELALCLLTEVAYEHDDDFRIQMPRLLHIAIICVDNDEVSHSL